MSSSVCAEVHWLKTSSLMCSLCLCFLHPVNTDTKHNVIMLLNALLHLNNGSDHVSLFVLLQVQYLLWHSICYLDMVPPFSATWLVLHTQRMPRKYAWHVKFHKCLVCIFVQMLDLEKRTYVCLHSTKMRATHTDWPVFTCHSVPHAASKPLRVTIKKMTPNG